jgi:hypothetical protein
MTRRRHKLERKGRFAERQEVLGKYGDRKRDSPKDRQTD